MEIDYKVLPTFAKVHQDLNPFLFIMGPVSSGKSSGCIFHAVLNAMKQKPDAQGVRHYRHLVVRATYPSLKATTIKTWLSWFKDKIKFTFDTPIVARLKFPMDDGTKLDMEIIFMAVDNDISAEKLRSLEVTSAHLNEASELTYGIFELVSTRTNRYPAEKDGGCYNPFIICDYNAVSTDHWLYKLAEEKKPEGFSFYRQPSAVIKVNDKYIINPEAENLGGNNDGYYERILMAGDEDFIQVNLMNNYGEVRKGRPVYKDYDDREHYVDGVLVPVRGTPVIIGVDQGLTPAAVFTQLQHDGTVIIFDEITTTDCSLHEFAHDHIWPLISTKYPWIVNNFTVVCDPATNTRSMNDAKSGTDVLREAGLPIKIARTNVFTERREAVISYLRRKDKFKISRDCPTLRKGFINEYKYDESRTVNGVLYKEKPSKNGYSHIHDALQYAMMEYYHSKTRALRERFASYKPRKYRIASLVGGY